MDIKINHNPAGKISAGLLAHNTILNFMGQVIPLICGVVAIPVVVKGLGIDAFGILSLAWVILGYFSIFDLGLSRATTKYVSESIGQNDTESVPGIVWTVAGIQLIMGVAGAVICVVLTPVLIERFFKIPAPLIAEAKITFYIIAVSLPVVLLSISLRGVLEASQRFDLVNWIKIPANSLVFLIPAVAVPFGMRLPGIVLLLIITRVISVIAYLFFCFRVFPSLKKNIAFKPDALKKIMGFGVWVTVSSVIAPVLNYVERFFIASSLSVGMLGYYTAPYEMLSRFAIVSNSIALTLFPAFSNLGPSKPANLEELFLRPVKYIFILMAPVAVFCYVFAGSILNIWVGPEFVKNSTVVFQVLVITFLLNSIAAVPFAAVQGIGRADLKAKFDIAETPVFIALIAVMISFSGINGVASSKLIITVIDLGLLFWASRRIIGFSLKGVYRYGIISALSAGALLALPVCAAGAFAPKEAALILFFVCFAAYIYFIWKFSLDDKDRNTLLEIRKRWL